MNKLGRCPQGDAKNQISKLYTFQFKRKKKLKMGFFVPMFQLVTHGLGPILTIGASYEHILVEVHQKMLHTKYQSSSPYGLGQEDFKKFPSISLCEIRELTTEKLFPS